MFGVNFFVDKKIFLCKKYTYLILTSEFPLAVIDKIKMRGKLNVRKRKYA